MHTYIVKLNNIKIEAVHGLYPSEKRNKQLFEIDIIISFCKKSCRDRVEETINYEHLYNIILNIFKDNTFNLIETLGEKIIQEVFKCSPARSASVTIRKPEIEFGDNSNCVEVSISKNNE